LSPLCLGILDASERANQGVKDQEGEKPADDRAMPRRGVSAAVARRYKAVGNKR